MTVYISKYALTQGIHVVRNAQLLEDGMIRTGKITLYHKGEWHHSLEEAMARAEQMRQKEVAALQRKIDKLRTQTLAVNG